MFLEQLPPCTVPTFNLFKHIFHLKPYVTKQLRKHEILLPSSGQADGCAQMELVCLRQKQKKQKNKKKTRTKKEKEKCLSSHPMSQVVTPGLKLTKT